MDLNKLLKPKSVAVIGASEKEGFGGDVCRNILSYVQDLDRVYFVHPKREQVFGKKCYKNVTEISDTIDLMIICTSQKTVIPLLQEGAKKVVEELLFLPVDMEKWEHRKEKIMKKN